KDFLGLRMDTVPADFVEKLAAYAEHFGRVTPGAIGVAVAALAIIILWPRVSHRIPAPFVALIVTTVAVRMWHLPVATVGSPFGEISGSIPHPHIPHLTLAQATALVGPELNIALLGAIESLLSAVV